MKRINTSIQDSRLQPTSHRAQRRTGPAQQIAVTAEKNRREQKTPRTALIGSKEKSNRGTSMVSDDDDFQCYNTGEGNPVHTNLGDELQLEKQT